MQTRSQACVSARAYMGMLQVVCGVLGIGIAMSNGHRFARRHVCRYGGRRHACRHLHRRVHAHVLRRWSRLQRAQCVVVVGGVTVKFDRTFERTFDRTFDRTFHRPFHRTFHRTFYRTFRQTFYRTFHRTFHRMIQGPMLGRML